MVLLSILVIIAGIIIRLIEELGRPKQFVVYIFHFNKLPLRHLVEQLDDKTIGPNGLVGKVFILII